MHTKNQTLMWKYGLWTEGLLRIPGLWLNSRVDLARPVDVVDVLGPMLGEATVAVDWSLPLTAPAMLTLWERLYHDFERATSIVPPEKKPPFRPKEAWGRIFLKFF